MKPEALMKRLTDNAIDFLTQAIDSFKTQPKYSVINFYTAVELFLKARLLHEHWSLVVAKDPDRMKFEAGDFTSVTFEVACERLEKVVQSEVPLEARKNFDAVRKHRNKMVHFFHEADFDTGAKLEAVALEQLRAWYDLHQLLTVQWAKAFRPYEHRFKEIEKKLTGHRAYLRAKFDRLAPKFAEEKAKGVTFRTCGSCRFESARQNEVLDGLYESECLVCSYRDKWLDFSCPTCSDVGPLREGGEYHCESCGSMADTKDIADAVNEFVATKHNYFEAVVPGNCAECDGYHTIIEYEDKYVCVVCFNVTGTLNACEYCGEHSNGDMEDSYLNGCVVCAGKMGALRYEDD